MTPTTLLIRDAQAGDPQAREDLFGLIYREHMRAVTRRYRARNVLLDDDDIESEFMLGCLKALERVDLERGNPLLYLFWKGNLAVAHLLRTRIQRAVRARCRSCGHQSRVQTRRGHVACRVCGSRDLGTYMVEQAPRVLARGDSHRDSPGESTLDRASMDADTVWGVAVWGVQVEEIRARLRGRVLELFDLIVVEEINRETSQNYIREIATRWGVSTAAVAIYLRKLRAAIEEYLRD